MTSEQYIKAKKWLKEHRKSVAKLAGEWIAYNEKGIIAHDKEQSKVIAQAQDTKEVFVLRFLHPLSFMEAPRLLPIRFRSLKSHFWEPLYLVTLQSKVKTLSLEMLVDSGADFSAVDYHTGIELGFKLTDNERILTAEGVNGAVQYVERVVVFNIDEHVFDAPLGWILDQKCSDTLLGREVVFDLFDVEFKQADEQILFKKRRSDSI
jgi:hypothetical protein